MPCYHKCHHSDRQRHKLGVLLSMTHATCVCQKLVYEVLLNTGLVSKHGTFECCLLRHCCRNCTMPCLQQKN